MRRGREGGTKEDEKKKKEAAPLLVVSSSPCRRLSAARIFRNSQTCDFNLLLLTLPPLRPSLFWSLGLSLSLSCSVSLASLCPPPQRSRSILRNPWSSAFYLLAASFIPPARFLPPNLPSILPVCSPAVASVYVCSPPRSRRPRVFDYLSCVLLGDFFAVVPSVSVYLSVAFGAFGPGKEISAGVSMPRTCADDGSFCSFLPALTYSPLPFRFSLPFFVLYSPTFLPTFFVFSALSVFCIHRFLASLSLTFLFPLPHSFPSICLPLDGRKC